MTLALKKGICRKAKKAILKLYSELLIHMAVAKKRRRIRASMWPAPKKRSPHRGASKASGKWGLSALAQNKAPLKRPTMSSPKIDKWLSNRLAKAGLTRTRERVQGYAKIYSRTKQLLPQMVDFVQTIFAERKAQRLNTQLVFLGRGARPFYRIAFRLAEANGVKRKNVKIVEAGRRLTGGIHQSPAMRKKLLGYMESKGVNTKKPITFVDTGVIGTVPNDLIQMFRLEGLRTKVNGYMFYGRDVPHKGVKSYSPSPKVKWTLPEFSEREVRSLIEELPKSIKTIKELAEHGGVVLPKYARSSPEERIGAALVRLAIIDGLREMRFRRK